VILATLRRANDRLLRPLETSPENVKMGSNTRSKPWRIGNCQRTMRHKNVTLHLLSSVKISITVHDHTVIATLYPVSVTGLQLIAVEKGLDPVDVT
jgi:hypothetical protein